MKKYLLLLLLSGLFSQNLPRPVIVGQDVSYPTLKISNFVKINEKVGIEDDRVKLGIRQLMEEAFSNSRYVLVDDDNADFVASAELVYVGQPNQAFSILGIFNRRNTNTQVNIEISMIDNKNNKTETYRGQGETKTKITATGFQISDDIPFNRTEFGGSVRKAIDNAMGDIN
tara:strand:- start:2339 stop:2854 length:516 start_codon:yes stop_codon:yes gene_type:complete